MELFQTTKILSLTVKDLDTVGRRVKVAFSKFGNIDSDNDVILRGAFAKSIQERGPGSEGNRKIQFLRHHDFEQQIGKMIHLEETNEFLIGVADLGRSDLGERAFLDYQDGIITEHSIGFFTIPDKTDFEDDGTRILKEVVLLEGSAVTFGSNSDTPTFEVSKGNKIEYLEKLNLKMKALTNALKNGQGTDERLYDIACNLDVYTAQYNSLIALEPLANTQENEPNPNEEEPKDGNSFYHNILKL